MASRKASSDGRTAADKTCGFVISRFLRQRLMCGFAAPSRLGADCCVRLYVGKLLFVARRHHSRDRVREWVYPGARAGNKPLNCCLAAEPPLSAKLTSPLSGAKLFIAKFIKYFPPLKGRGGGVSRRRGLIPWIIVEF